MFKDSIKRPPRSKLPIFADIETNCIYFESLTTGCKLYGSCQCKDCSNYVKS